MKEDNKSKFIFKYLEGIENEVEKKNNEVAKLKKDSSELEKEDLLFQIYNLAISWEYLYIINILLDASDIMEQLKQKKKFNETLQEIRKNFFELLITLENVYGQKLIDEKTDYELLKKISDFSTERLYNFIMKMKSSLVRLEKIHENLPKYRWNILDLKSRFLNIMKQMVNRRDIHNPNNPNYDKTMELILFFKNNLENVSEKFREKYFIVTQKYQDMQKAILYQEELKAVNNLLGIKDEAESCQKKIDSWKQILLNEEKKKQAL